MTRIFAVSTIIIAALLAPATAFADTANTPMLAEAVIVPKDQPQGRANVPGRGMTMEQVQRRWGKPTNQLGAVGEPPISRWVYDGFTVYFERRAVIHAVQHATQSSST